MKQLRLIAEDFDSLEVSCLSEGTGQYSDPEDCPIARAMKRKGRRVSVTWGHIRDSDTGELIYFKFDGECPAEDVENCRKKLLAGAKFAIIKIINNESSN